MSMDFASFDELTRCELLRGLPDATLHALSEVPAVRTLASGEILIAPDRANDSVYLLLSGGLSVHLCAPDTPAIRNVEPGLSVGELSVLDGGEPTAYIVARGESRVYALPRSQVFEMIGDACPLALNLINIMVHWIKTNTVHMLDDRSRIDLLKNHANLDGLTGLYNRRWLETALPEAMASAQPLCVILADVDHFKHYNDTQGHTAGDCALIALARVLLASVRPVDFVVRFGGEEFLLLLPGATLAEGQHIAERVRSRIEVCPISHANGTPLPGITLSAGIAMHAPGLAPAELIDLADAQLYRAKLAGRNRVCS
jgi:diguanylate cyclase (GGDEF)-like protein